MFIATIIGHIVEFDLTWNCLQLNFLKSAIHKSYENGEKYIFNLFVISKNEFTNSPIHESKVLQNVFRMKKQGLKCFLK